MQKSKHKTTFFYCWLVQDKINTSANWTPIDIDERELEAQKEAWKKTGEKRFSINSMDGIFLTAMIYANPLKKR